MPQISKVFHLEITPEQFIKNCSPEERAELRILMEKEIQREQLQQPKNGVMQQVIDSCLDIMDIAETQEFLDWPANEQLNLLHITKSALSIGKQIQLRNEK